MLKRTLLIIVAFTTLQQLRSQGADSATQTIRSFGYIMGIISNQTGSIDQTNAKDFNQGNVNDPGLLIRNKVAGLGVYKKGSNPNQIPHLRIRGISSITRDSEPLIVIDGVLGATLENVDPHDISSFTTLKSAAATSIYGMRGGNGVILVTTKKGKLNQELSINYRSYLASAALIKPLPSLKPEAFLAAGGNDLGDETNWLEEVSRSGFSHVHHLSASGGTKQTTYRVSFNARNVQGILKQSGFDQINTRAHLSHLALEGKLKVDFNLALTNRNSDLAFTEAFRYATVFNPTAPVRFDNGNFWEAILFDNFNPVAILKQNVNESKTRLLNYGLDARYALTASLAINANFSQQQSNVLRGIFYPSNSFFRGFKYVGLASRGTSDEEFSQFESWLSYQPQLNGIDFKLSTGYSLQQHFEEDLSISMTNLASNDQSYFGIDLSADQVLGFSGGASISSEASPQEDIRGFFGQAQVIFDEAIDVALSIRRDGSTRLGTNKKWGTFYSVGVSVDALNYLKSLPPSRLNVRFDFGTSGNLPFTYGLASNRFVYQLTSGGTVRQEHLANPDLQWETSKQTNFGIELGFMEDRLMLSADLFSRQNENLITRTFVDPMDFSQDRKYSNNSAVSTSGFDVVISLAAVQNTSFSWNTRWVISGYNAILDQSPVELSLRGNVGAPGQGSAQFIRLAVGEELGQFWANVFDGVDENGNPIFKDVNGDGISNATFGSALSDDTDFTTAGSAIPTLSFGWSNLLTFKRFDANLFLRGALGHTLVNTYRLFYEPIDPGAINSYNRVISEQAEEGLTSSYLSSLYYERADFLRLDNLTIGYNLDVTKFSAIKKIRLSGTVQNVFTLTGYTGTDPEAVLFDSGPLDNGGFNNSKITDQLTMGIDRRNFYYTARTFMIGVEARF
ncbi:MAG: TonB-dependent receptor domain-containing protein [Cyclobacteriaceae bacterium]